MNINNSKIIENFLESLKKLYSISDAELDNFKKIVTVREVDSKDYFIREGEKATSFAFVSEGLFKITYLHEGGNEFVKGFFTENSFIGAYSALIQNRESYFSIEAIENSIVIEINYNKFQDLVANSLNWHKFLVLLLQKAFCVKEEREREFLLYDATARYESFIRIYPNLSNRIKQNVLASYLGITPVALSRIKNKVNLV